MDLPFISTVQDFSEILGTDAAEENDLCNTVLRYINQVLMEDDLEDKTGMIQDSTLHAAEKSLNELLSQNHHSSPNDHLLHEDTSCSSDDSITHFGNSFSSSYSSTYNSDESSLVGDIHKIESSHVQIPSFDYTFLTNLPSLCPPNCSCDTVDGLVEPLVNVPLQNQCCWEYRGGIEGSKNILPSGDSSDYGFAKNRLTPPKSTEAKVQKIEGDLAESLLTGRKSLHQVKSDLQDGRSKKHFQVFVDGAELQKDEGDLPDSSITGRKCLHRAENDLEDGRSNKHFAVHVDDESVLHEMFDKVLSIYDGTRRELQHSERSKGSNFELAYTRKGATKREAGEMRSLLMQCMQSVAGNDHRTANKLLKQIRLRSTPSGDGSQRLAHYFANSLEARLVGATNSEYKPLSARKLSDADVLTAYKLYISTVPFMETAFFFSAQNIMEVAERASSIHIIHFGIVHGLQWPSLIQSLSTRPGGPPKLRLTGIGLPQAGFRPGARVKETGCRLANYCKKFNVPFEYNGIAQKWETLTVADIRVEKDEVLVVICLNQFMYLPDDTIMEHNPRDAILNFIKRLNPNIFIHGVVNGTYNSPFFISRFREALFHFSALFDMLETDVPRENLVRMVFEREVWGNEILNIIACEGLERIERPETYKQWQTRTVRAGFRQLPLNQEILKKVKAKLKSSYHKDFFVDEVNQWMLEGWKGRILFGLSCWKAA
ncbi:hypothetical protein U1Q18_033354 [Sarracenia purpurea var. burkii]